MSSAVRRRCPRALQLIALALLTSPVGAPAATSPAPAAPQLDDEDRPEAPEVPAATAAAPAPPAAPPAPLPAPPLTPPRPATWRTASPAPPAAPTRPVTRPAAAPAPAPALPAARRPAPLPPRTPAPMPLPLPLPAGEAIPADWGAADPQRNFIKGDIARVGAIELRSDYDRFALHGGLQRIGRRWYTFLEPGLDLKFWDKYVQVGLRAPLRSLYMDEEAPLDEAYQGLNARLRQEDWDEPGDFLKTLHYLTIGGKEQDVFLSLGQSQPVTIGHGPLVRRYAPNLDLDHTRTTFEVDLYNDLLGMEGFVGNVTSPSVLGGLFFVKPDALLGPTRPLGRLSLGYSVVSDLDAPLALRSTPRAGVDYFAVDGQGNPVFEDQRLTGMGVDAEIKVVRTATVDVKPYLDHSWLLGHGSGTSIGTLARFSLGDEVPVSALRLRGELRTFDADFLPGYFDTLYEFQRYQYATASTARVGAAPTKLGWLTDQAGGDRRFGYYLEATYALVGWFALSAAIEDATARDAKGLLLHAEIPANRYLTFFLTYLRRSVDSFAVPFEFEQDTEIFFWAVRLRLLPILSINYRSQRAFEVNRDARTDRDRLYENVFHFALDLELGYEF